MSKAGWAGIAPWLVALSALWIACGPPLRGETPGPKLETAAAETPSACETPCGTSCCEAGQICTANQCAAPSTCERETGPTPTRVEGVSLPQLERALGAASPGTRIVLAPGTYTQSLKLRAKGRPDAPVVLAAEPPGSVKISGGGKIELIGDHLVVTGFDFDEGMLPVGTVAILFRNCRHCRLTNSKIRRYLPTEGNWSHWVRFTTGHHNRLDHSEIHAKSDFREMIRITNFTKGFDRIDHNYIHDFIRTPPDNGGEAIRIGTTYTSQLRTTVDHNLFERVRAEQEIISVKSSGNTFHRNTFRDSLGELTIRTGNENVITENIFIASPQYPGRGVRAYGNGNRIEGNQFAGVRNGIRLGAGTASGKCYRPANEAIVRGNRFSDISDTEIITDFMLGWHHFSNCPDIDVPARGQTIEDNRGPADLSRAYQASDSCIGPTW